MGPETTNWKAAKAHKWFIGCFHRDDSAGILSPGPKQARETLDPVPVWAAGLATLVLHRSKTHRRTMTKDFIGELFIPR
jgi:hypothetical protein